MQNPIIIYNTSGIYVSCNENLDCICTLEDDTSINIFRIVDQLYIYSNQTKTFKVYNITSKDSIILIEYSQNISTYLTDAYCPPFLTFYKDTPHFITFNNQRRTLEIYQIVDSLLQNEKSKWKLVCDIEVDLDDDYDSRIIHIDFQDNFIYLLTHKSILHVLSPDYLSFGKIKIPTNGSIMLHPKLIGNYLYYINSENILYRYCIVNKELAIVTIDCDYFSYINKQLVILSAGKLIDLNKNVVIDTCAWKPIISNKHTKFLTLDINCDIRHGNSKYNYNHYVKTYFIDEMDENLQHILITLCGISKKLYDNKNLMDSMKLNTNTRCFPFLRDPYLTLYYGKDVRDLVKIKQNFFDKYTNYQELLNDMSSLNLDRISKFSINLYVKQIQQYIMKQGIDLNPFYILSGPFHFTWPMCGKGWHHNIENVPRQKCDVLYFITTDQNHYGGSFFFYRHPDSHLIHAVPDIHATMKLFQLVSNPENPLWHALGSYTAHRISWGLSRRSEMYESYDPSMNNPIVSEISESNKKNNEKSKSKSKS